MKLARLQPRIQSISTARLQVVTAQPDIVERKRGSAGVKDRAAIKRRDCGLCQMCKARGIARPGAEVDHKVPLWDGGTDDEDNKWLLCRPCHEEKTAAEATRRARGY